MCNPCANGVLTRGPSDGAAIRPMKAQAGVDLPLFSEAVAR